MGLEDSPNKQIYELFASDMINKNKRENPANPDTDVPRLAEYIYSIEEPGTKSTLFANWIDNKYIPSLQKMKDHFENMDPETSINNLDTEITKAQNLTKEQQQL